MKNVSILVLMLGALAGQAVFAAEERVLDKAGKGIKKGADATARGIEKGADAAGKGIAKGVEATGKGVKKAGEWIEKKASKDRDK